MKAQIAVLVAVQPPPEVETFVYRDGVWIVQRRYAKDLALMLRYSLIKVFAERATWQEQMIRWKFSINT